MPPTVQETRQVLPSLMCLCMWWDNAQEEAPLLAYVLSALPQLSPMSYLRVEVSCVLGCSVVANC